MGQTEGHESHFIFNHPIFQSEEFLQFERDCINAHKSALEGAAESPTVTDNDMYREALATEDIKENLGQMRYWMAAIHHKVNQDDEWKNRVVHLQTETHQMLKNHHIELTLGLQQYLKQTLASVSLLYLICRLAIKLRCLGNCNHIKCRHLITRLMT
jgi:hypothetical protein